MWEMDCKTIAERTGLNMEMVKSFCCRYGLRGEDKTLAELLNAKFLYRSWPR